GAAGPEPAPRSLRVLLQLLPVGLEALLRLLEGVAAELREEDAGDLEGDDRLADHAGGGDDADVRALVERRRLLLRREVDGLHRLAQRGDRLAGRADDDRLAVGHAALDAAGVVAGPRDLAALAQHDLVVHLRAAAPRRLEAQADLDRLDRLDRHQRAREGAVELVLPAGVGAHPGRRVEDPHLEDAPQGVAGQLDLVDLRLEPLVEVLVERVEHRLLAHADELVGRVDARRARDAADLDDVAQDADAEVREEGVGERAGGHSSRGLPGAGALGDVPRVVRPELHGAGEVGVPGPRARDRIELLGVLDSVHDLEGQDAAQGVALAHPGDDLRLVLFELHAGAAAVAALAPGELGVDGLGVQGAAVGEALDRGDEALPVRLSGGRIAQHGKRDYRLAEGFRQCPPNPINHTVSFVGFVIYLMGLSRFWGLFR